MKKFFSILGAFVVALSCLLIPVFSNDNYAKADSVDITYNYSTSNLYFEFSRIDQAGNTQLCDTLLFACDFGYNPLSDTFTADFSRCRGFGNLNTFVYDNTTYSYSPILAIYTNSAHTSQTVSYTFNSVKNTVQRFNVYYQIGGAWRQTHFFIKFPSALTWDFKTINIGGGPQNIQGTGTSTLCGSNYVSYVDADNNALSFHFRCDISDYNYLTPRSYYFNVDFTDNQYYDLGYNQGVQDGLLDNQQTVYNNGYSAGNTAGYSTGYNAGLNDANQYTFFNLFGSVLDAPVTVLMSILNFQLLGVNLWALFTGLLTLAVLIFVIKLFIGGK